MLVYIDKNIDKCAFFQKNPKNINTWATKYDEIK